jgi:NADPH-dependent ferric siderophore reductase
VAGRPVHTFEVLRSEQLTPHFIRVVLGGSGFNTFVPNDFTDAYVKVVFVKHGVDVGALPQPLTLDSFNELPAEQRPVVRTHTVRSVDTERRELAIDFVVHGDHGVAGPWASAATPGQPAYLMGPSGAYAPDPAAD